MVYHRSSQLNIFYILIEKTLYSPYLGYTPAIKDSNRISTIYICTICSGNSMITGFSIFEKKNGVFQNCKWNILHIELWIQWFLSQDLHARLPSWQRGLGTSLPAAVPSPGWMRAILGRWGIWTLRDAPILRWDFSEQTYTKMEGAPVLELMLAWEVVEHHADAFKRAPFSMIPVPRRGNKLPKLSDVFTSWTLWPPPSHLKHCLCRFQMLNQRHVV